MKFHNTLNNFSSHHTNLGNKARLEMVDVLTYLFNPTQSTQCLFLQLLEQHSLSNSHCGQKQNTT